MDEQMKHINLDVLVSQPLIHEPFPHLIISDFIRKDSLATLIAEYPETPNTGSYPCDSLVISSVFQEFIDEMQSDELRALLQKKFSMDLEDKPIYMTARGQCHPKDGKIHCDKYYKYLTLLLYMNPVWESKEGRLRLLRNGHDLNNIVTEIPPLAGTLLIFKVTHNSWHGHTSYDGERRVMQMNYINSKTRLMREVCRHRMAGALKRLQHLFSTEVT